MVKDGSVRVVSLVRVKVDRADQLSRCTKGSIDLIYEDTTKKSNPSLKLKKDTFYF